MSEYKQYNYSGPDELWYNFSGRYTTLSRTETGIIFDSSTNKNAKVSGMLLAEKIQGHQYKTYIIKVVAAALTENARPYIYTGFSQDVEDRVIIGPATPNGEYLEYTVQFTLPETRLFDFGVCFSQKNIKRQTVAVNSISLSCMEDDYYVLTHKDSVINSNKDFSGNSITVKKIILDQIEPTGNLNMNGHILTDVGGITLSEDMALHTLSISNAELVVDNNIILTDSNYPSYINNVMKNPADESLSMNGNSITSTTSVSFEDLSNPGATGFTLNVNYGNLNFEGNVIPQLELIYGDIVDLNLTNVISESVFIMDSNNGINLCAPGMATLSGAILDSNVPGKVQFLTGNDSMTANHKIGNETIFSIESYTLDTNDWIQMTFSQNNTVIYAFFVKYYDNDYSCGNHIGGGTNGYSTINGNLPISVLYKNGAFMPYVGTEAIPLYGYTTNTNDYYIPSINSDPSSGGITITNPTIKCSALFGVPIATTIVPTISINDAFNISMSVPLAQIPPTTLSGNFDLKLGIKDSVGRELIGTTGSFVPAFDITNNDILANNTIIYNYTSDPINKTDRIYNTAWNNGLTGPYSLTAYMSVNDNVYATNVGTTGAISYGYIIQPENITSTNLSDYISSSDINIGTHDITCNSITTGTLNYTSLNQVLDLTLLSTGTNVGGIVTMQSESNGFYTKNALYNPTIQANLTFSVLNGSNSISFGYTKNPLALQPVSYGIYFYPNSGALKAIPSNTLYSYADSTVLLRMEIAGNTLRTYVNGSHIVSIDQPIPSDNYQMMGSGYIYINNTCTASNLEFTKEIKINLSQTLANGNDAENQDITGVRDLTVSKLNYTSLSPAIVIPPAQTFSQILASSGDGGGRAITNTSAITTGTLNYTTLSPAIVIPPAQSLSQILASSGDGGGRAITNTSAITTGTLNYTTLSPAIVIPPAQTFSQILANSGDGGGRAITNTSAITTGTLNYTTLNPPVSSATQTLSQILALSGDGGGHDITNVSAITTGTLNYTTLNQILDITLLSTTTYVDGIVTIPSGTNGFYTKNALYNPTIQANLTFSVLNGSNSIYFGYTKNPLVLQPVSYGIYFYPNSGALKAIPSNTLYNYVGLTVLLRMEIAGNTLRTSINGTHIDSLDQVIPSDNYQMFLGSGYIAAASTCTASNLQFIEIPNMIGVATETLVLQSTPTSEQFQLFGNFVGGKNYFNIQQHSGGSVKATPMIINDVDSINLTATDLIFDTDNYILDTSANLPIFTQAFSATAQSLSFATQTDKIFSLPIYTKVTSLNYGLHSVSLEFSGLQLSLASNIAFQVDTIITLYLAESITSYNSARGNSIVIQPTQTTSYNFNSDYIKLWYTSASGSTPTNISTIVLCINFSKMNTTQSGTITSSFLATGHVSQVQNSTITWNTV
jgi:hypothetical protein